MTNETIPHLGGRPKGSKTTPKSKADRLFDKLMSARGPHLERILDGVLKLAEQGETWACKEVMNRAFPPRGRTVQLSLTGLSPTEAADRIIEAVDAGAVTPEEASRLLELVRTRAELAESANVEARIAALEAGE